MVPSIPASTSCMQSYSPCLLISDLIQRIADYIASIFATIANFVKSCCCVDVPPPSSDPMNSTHSIPLQDPNIEQGVLYLTDLVNRENHETSALRQQINLQVQHLDNFKVLLSDLLIYDYIFLNHSTDATPPHFLSSSTDFDFFQNLENMRTYYAQLSDLERDEALVTFNRERMSDWGTHQIVLISRCLSTQLQQNPEFGVCAERLRLLLSQYNRIVRRQSHAVERS